MQNSDLFSERLKKAVKAAGGAEKISKLASIPRRTLETYLSGQTEPKLSKIIALSQSCGVSVNWLITAEGDASSDVDAANDWVDLALFDNVLTENSLANQQKITESAQKAAISNARINDLLLDIRYLTDIKFRRPSLQKFDLDTDYLIAVRVSGNAMQPMIASEDTVLLDTRQASLRADDVGVFRVGPQLLARRLLYKPDGRASLSADQAGHSSIEFESHAAAQAAWIGKIVWIARWTLGN